MNRKKPYSYLRDFESLSIKQIEDRIALLIGSGFPESAKRFKEKYKRVLALKNKRVEIYEERFC